MSKMIEFAISSRRLAVIVVCLAFAGLIGGAALFATGVMLGPRLHWAEAEVPALPVAKILEIPKVAAAPLPEPVAEKPESPAEPPPEAPVPAPKPPEPSHPAADSKPPAVNEKPPVELDVRVGSFTDEKNAMSIVARLKHMGYPASAFAWTDAKSNRWEVVQVGPYTAYEAASRTVLDLSTRYRLTPVIIPSRSF